MTNYDCKSDENMTDYAGISDEEMASSIITSTCELLPKSFSGIYDHMHKLMVSEAPAPKAYSIMCGSMAEFYIRPLNTCITDTDFLNLNADQLTFYGDFPILPSDISGLSDRIECYRIESHQKYPAFVRLVIVGGMIYNWKYKKYEFCHAVPPYMCIKLKTTNAAYFRFSQNEGTKASTNIVNGPAIAHTDHDFPSDIVYSVWCPQWPVEAQSWPIRPRNHGWPTNDTISEVVQNGCHVVYVQHRSCRDVEEMWRLSFSVAEVILIQSWTKIQQIVYHLLRFFAKRELIQKDCSKEDEVLCPYHLKTLMLWTCEAMSPEWWNSSSVVAICCKLLQKLSKWLKRRFCSNYFIPDANLFHEEWRSTMLDKTERRLNAFCNSDILCQWFMDNYILPLTRKYSNVQSTTKLTPDYVIPLFDLRKVNVSSSLDAIFSSKFRSSHESCRRILNGKKCTSGIRESLEDAYHDYHVYPITCGRLRKYAWFPGIASILCFRYYDNLLHILPVASAIGCGMISWDSSLFFEFVQAISAQPKVIRSEYHNFPKTYTEQSSRFQFLHAQDLMQNVIGSNSRSEFQLLLCVMSKEFLRKAVEYVCHKCKCIAPAATAYLAALQYATSDYQQALRSCMAVLADKTFQKEALNAACLLFVDDVARIVGLCVLQKQITGNNLNRRLHLDLRLSPEVFTFYLAVLSAKMIYKHVDISHELPHSSFQMDEYLKALIKLKCFVLTKSGSHFNDVRQIIYRRTDSLRQTDSRKLNPLTVKKFLIDVLMDYALENMTSFYHVIRKDFGIQCNTADCYRASYLYKCRQYDEVLHLCERILREPDLQNELQEFAFANVLLLPPLDLFFDRDVQSLLGFHTLFYYLSPMNDDLLKSDLTDESTFAHWFARKVCYQEEKLSVSLQWHYSIACNYFFGRHFLARFLKVRCCIDSSLPYTEAMIDFAATKCSLPFERIIHKFLLEKLRIIKNRSILM